MKTFKRIRIPVFPAVLLSLGLMAHSIAVAADAPAVHFLGPTGLRGSVAEGIITVAEVEKGSPADGMLDKGDQIVGLGSDCFHSDPRRALAAAIDAAEAEDAAGRLPLLLKDGREVVLQLPVLGSYSPTAPYECAKTDRIVERAAQALLQQGQLDKGATRANLLGLMATGEKKYFAAAAETIRNADWIKPDQEKIDAMLKGDVDMGYVGWYWGYNLIALGEYYLISKDESVLPAMRAYALGLARGQDAGGLWGHRMATEQRNGRLPGYAQMNQPSLSDFMGMLFARKCGISDPVLDAGIEQTYAYVADHIGKGAFPYGVHGPQTQFYNNNGTSGSAAICLALAGNRQGAAFFSQLAATAFDELEQGHANTFFNPLWTPLGANLSGPEVTRQFFRKSLWFHNLHRQWDGGFAGDSTAGDQEGAALLAYCLPRKALVITGRDADPSIWVEGDAATEVVMRSKTDYKSMDTDALMDMAMNSPIPQVRRQAAAALGDRREALTPTWITYLKTGTAKQKKLAISQYGWWIPIEQKLDRLDDIGAILRDPEAGIDLRVAAAEALCHFGEPAHPYYMDMVALVGKERPDDRFGEIDQALGKCVVTLCETPFAKGLVTDRDAFYAAAAKLMDHKRQHGREYGVKMLADIPLEDFHRVGGKVVHIIENQDPTYHSYHAVQGSIGAAISLLANLRVKEGLDYLVQSLEGPGKWGFKFRMLCATLPKYGAHARETLEQIKTNPLIQKDSSQGRFKGMWDAMVQTIESDENPGKLITLEEAMKAGEKK